MSYPLALPARYALSRSYYTRTMIMRVTKKPQKSKKKASRESQKSHRIATKLSHENFSLNAWESHGKRMPNSWESVEATHQLTTLIFSLPSTTSLCHSSSSMQPRSVLQPLLHIWHSVATCGDSFWSLLSCCAKRTFSICPFGLALRFLL
jgi:hypothetical protein